MRIMSRTVSFLPVVSFRILHFRVRQLTDNMAPCSDGSEKDLDEENRQFWEGQIRDLQHDLDEMGENSPEYNMTKESIEEARTRLSVFYDSKGNLRNEKSQKDKARINISRAIKRAKGKIIEGRWVNNS